MNHSLSMRWIVLLALFTPLVVSGEVIGFSADDNKVTELLLSRPGETIPQGESWTFPGLFPIFALERDVDGTLLALHTQPISVDRVSRLDLESGTVTEVTSLSVGQRELALDPSGVLWIMRFDGELRAYDFAAKQLGPRLMIDHDGADRVAGIAWQDGRLYAIFNGEQLEDGPTLGVVDTTTGAVSDLRELVALRPEPSIQRFVTGLDFDDAGGLWVGLVDSFAIADPPIPMPAVAHMSSPAAAVAEIRPLDDLRFSVPLAVTGGLSITEIPTLGSLAATLLALLLLAAALTRLTRA